MRTKELLQQKSAPWSENYSRSLPEISTWLATCLPATSHTPSPQPRDVEELRFIMHCRNREFQHIRDLAPILLTSFKHILWSWNLFAHRALKATLKCTCFFSHSTVSERGRWFRGLVQNAPPPPTASVAASKFSTVRSLVNPLPGPSIGLNAHLPRYVKCALVLLFYRYILRR